MSNISSGEVRSFSSGNTASGSGHNNSSLASASTVSNGSTLHPPSKKKRNLPGTPDPNAEVIALSPTTLMATNRFVCEICNKGFQRDQNLQLHRRGHNLPWKLKQRAAGAELRKRVYVCPEASCVHHNPARALGDLTGIKKHFSRKHGEKKWKCERCSKKYAVHSDWKAHSKTCGTREYKCDCGTIFSRRDSFITHRAFCDALTEENSKANQGFGANIVVQNPSVSEPEHKNTGIKTPLASLPHHGFDNNVLLASSKPLNVAAATGTIFSNSIGSLLSSLKNNGSVSSAMSGFDGTSMMSSNGGKQPLMRPPTALMSATALLQKAAQMGATATQGLNSPVMQTNCASKMASLSSSSMDKEVSQQFNGSYGHAQAQANGRPSTQTTTPINAGLLDNHHRQPEEINSHFLSTNNGNDEDQSSLLSNMGMFNRLLFDQNGSLFMKNMEQAETNGPVGNDQNHGSPGLFGGGRETMTVDFLGIGGTGPPRGLEERHRELLSNHRMLGLNHQFHHQQVSPLEKAMWEV